MRKAEKALLAPCSKDGSEPGWWLAEIGVLVNRHVRVLEASSPWIFGYTVRILTFSTLYPSAVRPMHGIFVETRLRKLIESGAVNARVVAPCQWFAFASPRFGDNSVSASTPRTDNRH